MDVTTRERNAIANAEVSVISIPDPDPCVVLSCPAVMEPVAVCKVRRCPFAWARSSREDRERQQAHDAKEKAG